MCINGSAARRLEQQEQTLSVDIQSDDWELHEYAGGDRTAPRRIRLHFSDAAGHPVKVLIKQYALWRLGRVKPVTVRQELMAELSFWLKYMEIRRITDPRRFDAAEYRRFFQWLQLRGIGRERTMRITAGVSRMIAAGQRLGWAVTEEALAQDAELLWQCPPDTDRSYAAPIPPDIYERILSHAVFDETDEVTRCGIIVQSQTGLRISEILSLRESCIRQQPDGTSLLFYQLKKTQRGEPAWRCVPANGLVCGAVERLRQSCRALRDESGRNELFLVRNHGIRPVSQTNWNKGRLKAFMERWHITDAAGEIYALHSHQFRATYVQRQILSGGAVGDVQEQLGHLSAEMTMRYVHLTRTELQGLLEPYIGG